MTIMMMIITPFGQLLGLWAPSSGVRDVFSLAYMRIMITSSFGQLGLWAPSSDARDVFKSFTYAFPTSQAIVDH
jgi:hypothetical protein